MDLEQFKTLTEKYKDDAELTSALSRIESEATALVGKKETAVGNEQKLREVKQSMAELLGLEKDVSSSDLTSKANDLISGYKQKIDSFEKNASSKDLENASVKEQLANLTNQFADVKSRLENERNANKLNETKDKLRSALAENRITDAKAQDMAISANLSSVTDETDYGTLAKSIAESNPFLTSTAHKGGNGTLPSRENNINTGLADVKINDKQGRLGAISAMIEANPNKGY